MKQQYKYMVAVRCYTYNQSPYIIKTLDGFTIQQTNFPYVCLIVDDNSTDGEQGIIKGYLHMHFDIDEATMVRREEMGNYNLIFARHRNNTNCFFAVLFLMYNHYSIKKDKFPYLKEWNDNAKYHAWCEGDDYWIHPEKLQMQVDFLETHIDYGMVHTDFDLTKGRRRHIKEEKNDDGNWFPRILTEGMGVGTCTVMLRQSIYEKTPKLNIGRGWLMGDYPVWIEMAHEARIKYLPVVTAKYRVLESSASHSTDINKLIAFKNNGVEISRFYAGYYHVPLPNNGLTSSYYEGIVRYACRLGDEVVAEKYYRKAKEMKLVSRRCIMFYLATKYSIVKLFLELYRKI